MIQNNHLTEVFGKIEPTLSIYTAYEGRFWSRCLSIIGIEIKTNNRETPIAPELIYHGVKVLIDIIYNPHQNKISPK